MVALSLQFDAPVAARRRGKGGERMIFGIVFLCGAAVGVAAYRWGMREGIKAYEQGMNRQKYGSGL